MGKGWGVLGGAHPKTFDPKAGPSQKLRGKGGHAGICTGLRDALKGKLEGGGVRKNFQR